jgi:hypothetical protein
MGSGNVASVHQIVPVAPASIDSVVLFVRSPEPLRRAGTPRRLDSS